jgi:uncharacterized protein
VHTFSAHTLMNFEWDESKRLANIERHGLDFLDAILLFDGRPVVTLTSPYAEEERFLSVGMLDGRYVTAVWTWRSDTIRLISARSARNGERSAHKAHHAW